MTDGSPSHPRNRPDRFTDRVVLITGAARGQGRAHAVRLAREGADVALIDACAGFETTGYEAATPDDLAETVAEVEATGRRAIAHVGDVRSAAALDDLVAETSSTFGRLDGVVANAAICSYGRLWDLSPEQWREMIDVNLTGVWHTLRATVPAMIEAGNGGSIVLTSSGAGLKGLPLLGHYGATKWALVGMARTLANEVAEHSIRVNTIHPTAVRTPMGRAPDLRAAFDAYPGFTRSFGNMLPIGSVEPDDISDAVLWLLSDEAKWVTAATIPVDAGAAEV
jgi:SDR family mycofactocin-dependent oxidoreductase